MMTRFAKLRAGESFFDTFTGKYHSPGGGSYYAAAWCNDQIEYAGPHFALTGDKTAIEASLNAYRSYIPFMSDAYTRLPDVLISISIAKTGQSPVAVSPLQMEKQMEEGQ